MQTVKRAFSLVLALCLAAALLPARLRAAGIAASGTCGEGEDGANLTWVLDTDGTLTITGRGRMGNFDWNSGPFYKNHSITTVRIESGVTSIGDYAFCDCDKLTGATIPEGVTSIGKGAFLRCESLTRSALPNSVTSIGKDAFNNCAKLPEAVIPDNVTEIGEGAFRDCGEISTLKLGASVRSIGEEAFRGCKKLTGVAIPDSVTKLGSRAFYDCLALKTVTLGSGLTGIGEETFAKCTNLLSVSIPGGVTDISKGAFTDCYSITDIYYGGSEEQWAVISTWDANDPLSKAAIHYNSGAPAAPAEPVTPPAPPAEPSAPKVERTSQKLKVNGASKSAEIYNIDGSNYFKLRDVAMLLNGTSSQFSVEYDAARQTIVIKTGERYRPVGGELVIGEDKSATAKPSTQSVEIDGVQAGLKAYNLGGNNFFKLRDLGNALGFNVDYDQITKTMLVTSK